MKIRMQANSVRIRLSKSEVEQLSDEGIVTAQTCFGSNFLTYAVKKTSESETLSASFESEKITMHVPESCLENWATNEVVGFNETVSVGENLSLFLLLEKDFKCMDKTTEDQSDNYENPGKIC